MYLKRRHSFLINQNLVLTGCMIGVKVHVHAFRNDENEWIKADTVKNREIEGIIWNNLSVNLKNMVKDFGADVEDHYRIMQSLWDLHSNSRDVKHVGHNPVQFIIHCSNPKSLHQLKQMCEEDTLAERLESCLITPTLRELGIVELTLKAHISDLEFKFCDRILSNKGRKLVINMHSDVITGQAS